MAIPKNCWAIFALVALVLLGGCAPIVPKPEMPATAAFGAGCTGSVLPTPGLAPYQTVSLELTLELEQAAPPPSRIDAVALATVSMPTQSAWELGEIRTDYRSLVLRGTTVAGIVVWQDCRTAPAQIFRLGEGRAILIARSPQEAISRGNPRFVAYSLGGRYLYNAQGEMKLPDAGVAVGEVYNFATPLVPMDRAGRKAFLASLGTPAFHAANRAGVFQLYPVEILRGLAGVYASQVTIPGRTAGERLQSVNVYIMPSVEATLIANGVELLDKTFNFNPIRFFMTGEGRNPVFYRRCSGH